MSVRYKRAKKAERSRAQLKLTTEGKTNYFTKWISTDIKNATSAKEVHARGTRRGVFWVEKFINLVVSS